MLSNLAYRCGEECVSGQDQGGFGHGFGGMDTFSNFFGDFGFGGGREERDVPRGGNIQMPLEVSLEELYIGNFVEVGHLAALGIPTKVIIKTRL